MMSVSASGNWHGTVSSVTLIDINYSSPRELGWTDVFKKRLIKFGNLTLLSIFVLLSTAYGYRRKKRKAED